jgi:hypothetical protein
VTAQERISSARTTIGQYFMPGQTIEKLRQNGSPRGVELASALKQMGDEATRKATEAETAYRMALLSLGRLQAAVRAGNVTSASIMTGEYEVTRNTASSRGNAFYQAYEAFKSAVNSAWQNEVAGKPGVGAWVGAAMQTGKEVGSTAVDFAVRTGQAAQTALKAGEGLAKYLPIIALGLGAFYLYSVMPKGSSRSEGPQ